MTKIYEALEKLENRDHPRRQQGKSDNENPDRLPEVKKYDILHQVPVPEPPPTRYNDLRGIYSGMLFRIEGAIKKNGGGNMVQIVGSREGEGASTVARELARTAVRDFSRKVLLIDLDTMGNSPFRHYAENEKTALPESSRMPVPSIPGNIIKREGDALHLASLTNSEVVQIASTGSNSDSNPSPVWKNYDLVIIDSPPLERRQNNPFFSMADTVILVVEAEKTRHQVVRRARECIERQGGNLLGIVLNKKQFHVPDWLYHRL